METKIVKGSKSRKVVTKSKEVEVPFGKGDKVSFHPYRQKKTIRGIIVSKTPTFYDRKKDNEKIAIVTIKTRTGELLTKTVPSLTLIEKAKQTA